jgi:ribosomal-protein-alanine N-acetyltransferase
VLPSQPGKSKDGLPRDHCRGGRPDGEDEPGRCIERRTSGLPGSHLLGAPIRKEMPYNGQQLGIVDPLVIGMGGEKSMSRMQDISNGRTRDSTQYCLRTERLGFRQWSEADLRLAIGLWGDKEVTKLIGGPFSQVQVEERLAQEISNQNANGIQYWPIFLLSNDEHLGCCGLRPYRLDRRVYEIGVHIRSSHWGQGYALEAARAVMEYAFDRLGASGLFAGHHPMNEASHRLLEKLGFQYTQDEFYPPTGLHHPSYIITADEFERSHGHPPERGG